MSSNEAGAQEVLTDLRRKTLALIAESLQRNYASQSSPDGPETGNHYQSVSLDGDFTQGFRSSRTGFLDQVDFRGLRVLDLGSNLGELSRSVRDLGAAEVDGFEYDDYFVALARLINAYRGTTKVSFFQTDITDPMVYSSSYDLVMAFSVFTYVRSVLEQIAACTDVLLMETHNLKGNLHADYIRPVSIFFRHHHVLGESDWGRHFDDSGGRQVVLFGKEKGQVSKLLKTGLVS